MESNTCHYHYKKRYSPAPECELSYMNSACDTYERRNIPKDYHSEFGQEYENWKMGQTSQAPEYQDVAPWDFYQSELFGTNRISMQPSYNVPSEGFFNGQNITYIVAILVVLGFLFFQTR